MDRGRGHGLAPDPGLGQALDPDQDPDQAQALEWVAATKRVVNTKTWEKKNMLMMKKRIIASEDQNRGIFNAIEAELVLHEFFYAQIEPFIP